MANSASRRCWFTLPPPIVETDVIEVMELTELLGPCVYLELVEEIDGLEPCVGVAGDDAAEDPNSRRVEENSLDGKRREEEYCPDYERRFYAKEAGHTLSFQSTTHFSIQGIKLIVTNSRTNRPT